MKPATPDRKFEGFAPDLPLHVRDLAPNRIAGLRARAAEGLV